MEPTVVILITLIGSLVLFLSEVLRYDLVALLVVLVLVGTNCLTPDEAFSNLSSGAVILISSMYVFSAAITRWGVADALGQRLLASGSTSELSLILKVMVVTGLLSGVLSNTGVVAIMIPIVTVLARQMKVPVSVVLIPMAYASLMGGLLSLIATSKNVAVNDALVAWGTEPFTLFEFTHFGLLLLALTIGFFIWPGRRLLPRRRVAESLSEHYSVPKFVTEVLVQPASTMINRSVSDLEQLETLGIKVLGIVREGQETILAPGPYNRLRLGDTLILQGEPEAIVQLQETLGIRKRETLQMGSVRLDSADVKLTEVVIPQGSPLVGRTLKGIDFHARSGLNVLAIAHRGAVEKRMAEGAMDVGDTLLVQAHQRDLDRARRGREVVVLGELGEQKYLGRGALITVGLLIGMLLVAGFNLLPLQVAALAGALSLVLTRCITVEEAYASINFTVVILVGGMLALGKAFKEHEMGEMVAQYILSMSDVAQNPYVMLAALMLTTAVLTQLATHIAAAVIMAQVAVDMAVQMGISDRAFLMGVLTASSCAFMSPVAHASNTMVLGPGDYKYSDFLRVGTPLTIFILGASWCLLPVLWPF